MSSSITLCAHARHCFSSRQSPAFFFRPVSSGLSFRSSHFSLLRRLKDSGSVVSWLPSRSRCCRFSSWPKSRGSSVSLFLLKSTFTRCVKVQKLSWKKKRKSIHFHLYEETSKSTHFCCMRKPVKVLFYCIRKPAKVHAFIVRGNQ